VGGAAAAQYLVRSCKVFLGLAGPTRLAAEMGAIGESTGELDGALAGFESHYGLVECRERLLGAHSRSR
jgi:hypothetical protein